MRRRPATEEEIGAVEAELRDPSGGKASYWLRKAAAALDCAVQCCGTDDSAEIDRMERRCDELAEKLAAAGR